jgi:hypothetical protein
LGGVAVALPVAAFEYMETADAIMAREIAHAWTGRVAGGWRARWPPHRRTGCA